jgi:hypothetical protein
MKAKTLFNSLIVTVLILTSNILMAHNGEGDEPTKKEDKIQVITSQLSFGDATINWSDKRIDFIEISSNNGQFMPSFPVLDASSLHLNDLLNGNYTINFIANGEIIYSKSLLVQR